MFCKTSPQMSFFDVQKVLPNVLPKDDWCYLYRDQVYPFIDEEIFRERNKIFRLYHSTPHYLA